MPAKRRVKIAKQKRLFDDFFKVDEIVVAHRCRDGAMSAPQRRLVFERGDAAAVLVFNRDRQCVVLVEQFRAPALLGRRRDRAATTDGWIVETIAGMVDPGETPAGAAIRECMEETGYRIGDLKTIATFFSSPGGTSERIFLYFAAVRDADRVNPGGGLADEDIAVRHVPVRDLLARLGTGAIDDPKLIIAAYWLKDHLQSDAKRRAPAA